MRSAIASEAGGVGLDGTATSGAISGSLAITGSGACGAAGTEAVDSAAAGSAVDGRVVSGTVVSGTVGSGTAAVDPDSIGSVLLISIEGLESEDAGLIGSVSIASAARCELRKLKGVITFRFEDAGNADVFLSPSRDKLT